MISRSRAKTTTTLYGAGLTTDSKPDIFGGRASNKPDDYDGAEARYVGQQS